MIYRSKIDIKPYNYDSYKYDDNIGIEGMIHKDVKNDIILAFELFFK